MTPAQLSLRAGLQICALAVFGLPAGAAPIEVPDFTGMTAAEAQTTADGLGLDLTLEQRSSAEPLDRVYRQFPREGATLDSAAADVLLRLSDGITLPRLVGRPVDEVLAELGDLGVSTERFDPPGEAERAGERTVEEVSAADPAEGSRIDAARQVVFLTVVARHYLPVPDDLLDLQADDAEAQLTKLGFTVRKDGYGAAYEIKCSKGETRAGLYTYPNRVTGISPAPGTVLARGDEVVLKVEAGEARRRPEGCGADGSTL